MINGESKYVKQEAITKYVDNVNKVIEKIREFRIQIIAKAESYLTDINRTELIAETNRNISAHHTFCTILSEQRMKLSQYENKLSAIEGDLFNYYRFDWDRSTKLSETAISKYVYAHDCYLVINNLIDEQKITINYISDVIDVLKNRNFAIKNIIDVKKMELNL